MKNKIFSCLLVIIIVVSTVFAVSYAKIYAEYRGGAASVFLCIAVIYGMASIMTIASLVLYVKAKKGAWVDAVYILTAILCIPVILCAMNLLLHWMGIDFLVPPPQN
ncbi:MAG: hypothetical protein IKL21_02300 [Clostridia bacterium]|nr:hypothetical protein [Clostridia bacterium]